MKKFVSVLVLVMALMLATGSLAFAAPEQKGQTSIHVVAPGDTVTGIANRYGVSSSELLRFNGLANPNMIYEGQRLIIPGPDYGDQDAYLTRSYGGCSTYHVVDFGETLFSIARRYQTSVHELAEANHLYNENIIVLGQRLCIPGPSYGAYPPVSYTPAPASGYHHTVARGETLSLISVHYNVNMWELSRANNLRQADFIHPGQRLFIPGYRPAPVPAPPPVINYPPVAPPPPKPHHDHPPVVIKEPKPPALYLRLGRNVGYEEWGRPKFGLDDCDLNLFDDSDPVQRFTAEVLLTNNSVHTIPASWSFPGNVIVHTLTGAERAACRHQLDKEWLEMYYYDLPRQEGSDDKVDLSKIIADIPDVGGFHPKDLAPGQSVDVTFYTHLEKGDIVTKMEFVALGMCFDPNSGDRVACGYD